MLQYDNRKKVICPEISVKIFPGIQRKSLFINPKFIRAFRESSFQEWFVNNSFCCKYVYSLFTSRVELDDPQRYLPTSTILWLSGLKLVRLFDLFLLYSWLGNSPSITWTNFSAVWFRLKGVSSQPQPLSGWSHSLNLKLSTSIFPYLKLLASMCSDVFVMWRSFKKSSYM